jgi:hypothetical protein
MLLLRTSMYRFLLTVLLILVCSTSSTFASFARAQTAVNIEVLADWTTTPSMLGDMQLVLGSLVLPQPSTEQSQYVTPIEAFSTLWILREGSAVLSGSGSLLYGTAPASPEGQAPADIEIAAGVEVELKAGEHVDVPPGVSLTITWPPSNVPTFVIISLVSPPLPP